MKVKEFINLHPELKDTPIICIDSSGINNYYDNSNELLTFGIEKDFEYINGACQLDLNGEDDFIIIFCTCI